MSPCKNQQGDKETRDIADTELLPLSIATSVNQQKGLEMTKDETLLMPPNRLSLVLEIEDVLSTQQQANVEQNTSTLRPTVGGTTIDSPHPIKHCQIRCSVGTMKK